MLTMFASWIVGRRPLGRCFQLGACVTKSERRSGVGPLLEDPEEIDVLLVVTQAARDS